MAGFLEIPVLILFSDLVSRNRSYVSDRPSRAPERRRDRLREPPRLPIAARTAPGSAACPRCGLCNAASSTSARAHLTDPVRRQRRRLQETTRPLDPRQVGGDAVGDIESGLKHFRHVCQPPFPFPPVWFSRRSKTSSSSRPCFTTSRPPDRSIALEETWLMANGNREGSSRRLLSADDLFSRVIKIDSNNHLTI